MTNMDHLKAKIRHVPDFPKAGILFYDITTLMQDPAGFRAAIDGLAIPFEGKGIDLVVGIESRGFIFGAAVAMRRAAQTTAPETMSADRRRARVSTSERCERCGPPAAGAR